MLLAAPPCLLLDIWPSLRSPAASLLLTIIDTEVLYSCLLIVALLCRIFLFMLFTYKLDPFVCKFPRCGMNKGWSSLIFSTAGVNGWLLASTTSKKTKPLIKTNNCGNYPAPALIQGLGLGDKKISKRNSYLFVIFVNFVTVCGDPLPPSSDGSIRHAAAQAALSSPKLWAAEFLW